MRISILYTALCLTPLTIPAQVFADEQPTDSTKLEKIVILGAKQASSLVIDLEQKELQQASSLFETLKNESSIDIGGGGASNAKRIFVRGVESSMLNISIDGAPQGKNIFQHRGNELGVNPDILKVINIQTAPDASKANALSGAMTMQIKDAQDFIEDDKTGGGSFKAGYNSNTQSKLGNLTAYKVFNEHFGLVASASGVNTENYEDGKNQEMLASAYEDRNYLLKFNLDDINGHSLAMTFNVNSNSGDMQWGKTGSDKGLNIDPSLLEEIASSTSSYSLQHNYSNGQLLNLDTDLYLTNILVDRRDAGSEYENDKIGIILQNHFYIDTESAKNDLSVGFQMEEEESTSNQAAGSTYTDENSNPVTSGYDSITSNNNALFVQGTTTINSIDIRYGLRWDDYDLKTGLGEASDSTLSPNVGLNYQLNKHSNTYVNYGRASRMAGTIPFTWMMHIADGYSYSSDLKAETSARTELGYSFMQNNLFKENDTFGFNISIFQTEIDNLILSKSGLTNAGGKTSVAGEAGIALTDIINSDKTHISKGFELKGSYFISDYFASLSYTQLDTNTTIESAGEPLTIRRVAGFDSKKIALNMGMEIINGFTLDYTLIAVSNIDNEQLKRDGYVVHDINTKYKTSNRSPFTFYAAIHNLTNKYYAPHTTLAAGDFKTSDDYRRELGRDIRLSVKYEF